MSKFAFFGIVFLTYYLAAQYRYPILLVMCVTELLLAVLLFILPRWLIRKVKIYFPKELDFAEANTDAACVIGINYPSIFPISRLSIRLRMGYVNEKAYTMHTLFGGCERGKNELSFYTAAPCCGIIEIAVKRLRVYDYLSMFSAKMAQSKSMRLVVFPNKRAMNIAAESAVYDENAQPQAQENILNGDARDEIRQIREYQPGDSNRYIHWNLSARTNNLWIKEYEHETDKTAHILLDLKGLSAASLQQRSAFYTLLSALILGLLNTVPSVCAHMYSTKAKGFVKQNITNLEQCRELLLFLYNQQSEVQPELKNALASADINASAYFSLDIGLKLCFNSAPLYTFKAETLETELAEKIFTI